MHIIVAYGEINLKSSSVQKKHIQRLKERIGEKLDQKAVTYEFIREEGRLFIDVPEEHVATAVDGLSRIPGIEYLAPCLMASKDMEDIKKTVLTAIEGAEPESFAVDARRVGEDHGYTSKDIENEIGQAIVDEHDWDVDLDHPDLTVHVEARYRHAYIYTEKVRGIGGIAIDPRNRVVVPLRDRVDVYAAFLLMKRGNMVIPVYNGNNPDEVEEGVDILTSVYPGTKLITFRKDSIIDAVNEAADLFDADAIGIGITCDELDSLDESQYNRQVLKPTIAMDEDEVLDAYSELAVPEF